MTISRVTVLPLVAAVALLSACSKQSESAAHGEDDGHGHGPGGHGAAHTETKDGVVMCAEHGVPEAQCAVCKPDLAAKLKPGESMKVRLPSTNSMGIVGVHTATPETGDIAVAVECVAEVSFNLNKLAQIAAPVSGIIQTVDADLGAKVDEKQTVAKIWSASIAEAVAKAVLAHQTLDRERRLREQRVTSEQALQEAEASHRGACQQLRTLGFTEEQIDEMGHKPQEQVLMEVRAPFAGEIVERVAVRGSLVDAGKPLFTLVDHSTVWAMLQVPETTLARVKVGQSVELQLDSLPGKVFTGKLTWVGPAVDERTRMARARAEFANPDCLLKDKMFATARILTRKAEGAMLVPPSAIQHVEGKPFIFVWLGDDLFDARAVTLGAKFNGRLEVLAGLARDEQIAVSRAFAVKSAMLMSRLGAGCADD
ncbi:MAG: efflux RND transporter periplasmic adaptor subunit [Opitutaceae bacterium]|nr:efflux RND transporter periplasmic adaptor subunit [Opitutaceae bacterium]